MHADADHEIRRRVLISLGKIFGDRLLHGHTCLHRLLGGGEGRHNLVADGFDDGAVVAIDLLGHQIQTLGHQLTRDGIAEGFVEARAAADIREYDRPHSGLFRHCSGRSPAVRSDHPLSLSPAPGIVDHIHEQGGILYLCI